MRLAEIGLKLFYEMFICDTYVDIRKNNAIKGNILEDVWALFKSDGGYYAPIKTRSACKWQLYQVWE